MDLCIIKCAYKPTLLIFQESLCTKNASHKNINSFMYIVDIHIKMDSFPVNAGIIMPW